MKTIKTNHIGSILLMVNAFVYISSSFYSPFLSSYYSKAGMSAVQIGVLLTIGPIIAIFIQPLWAVLSDRTERRKDILSLVILGSGISMFTYYLGKSFLTFFIATLLLSVFCTSIIPLSDAIILHNTYKYRLDFTKIRMGGTIGYAIVVIIAGAIVKQNPEIQFILGSLGYLMLLLFVRKLPGDEREGLGNVVPEKKQNTRRFQPSALLHIFETKQIYFILAFAFIGQVGISFNSSFIGVYMVKLNLSEGLIGYISCIAALSEIPILFLINRVLRKISIMKLTIFSCLILSIRFFIVTGGSIGFIIIAQSLHGLTYMIMYICCAVYISKNVKQENQSKGQSILAIIQTGIGSIVGNIVGGFFVDQFGLNLAYQYIAIIIISFSGIILILQLITHQKSKRKLV